MATGTLVIVSHRGAEYWGEKIIHDNLQKEPYALISVAELSWRHEDMELFGDLMFQISICWFLFPNIHILIIKYSIVILL